MPRLFLLAMLASFPLIAQPSVGVFMEFESAPGAHAVEAMEQEVASLFHTAGVAIEWRLAAENHGSESFDGLVVLKFKGKCRVDPVTLPRDFGTVGEMRQLGTTKVVHGRVLPYSEVSCDEVRQALSYLAPGMGKKERQSALGVAMGRVVAHELYHVLARTTSHAARGLAKASQSLEELVSAREIGFRDEDSRAIRAGLKIP